MICRRRCIVVSTNIDPCLCLLGLTFAARSDISMVISLPSSSTRGLCRTTVARRMLVVEKHLGGFRLGARLTVAVRGVEDPEMARHARK